MATPNLTTECTAFPTPPYGDEQSYSTSVIFFEDDASQVYRSGTTKHREIRLSYENQSDSEKASFEAFFNARGGQYEVFYWNNIRTGETDIKVRFLEDKVEYKAASARTWNWIVTLKKVL